MKKLLLLSLLATTLAACKTEQTAADSGLFVQYQKPKGATFSVAKVEAPASLLEVHPARAVFEAKTGKKITFFPEEQASYGLVPCAAFNGLMETVHLCYDSHRPLLLTPDVIWLAICQGASVHINEKYDSLKNIIFVKDKPSEIRVQNDSLEHGGKHWASLVGAFANETRPYTRSDFYSFFVPTFSTTTPVHTAAYQITLLESYKKAFTYIGESGCGIPSITLAGTPEDWRQLAGKADQLQAIGLGNWAKVLKPVLAEFVAASEGHANPAFWQNMYKTANEYGGMYLSGWIIKFFPYIKEESQDGVWDEKEQVTVAGEVFLPNPFMEGDSYLLSTLSTDNFPSGFAKVNVIWENHFNNTVKNMEVYAGFMAIRQYPDQTLEPFVSWAICDSAAAPPAKDSTPSSSTTNPSALTHTHEYWSPHLATEVTDPAVYDIKTFKTAGPATAYLRTLLLDSLQAHPEYSKASYAGDTVKVVILSNGSVGGVTVGDSKQQPACAAYLHRVLLGMPKPWFPALAYPATILDLVDAPEEATTLKVRANSVVKIGL